MSYLGNTPTTQSFISGTDYFNGNGSTTAFTLTRTVNSVNDIEAVVNNVVQQPNSAYTLSGTTITFTSAPSSGTNNIYVRYLSTTTQSITPSQNTVSYSTLNTDMQSGGYASNFKNRIINGGMVIDQRNAGASVSMTTSTWGVDRYRCFAAVSSKMTAQQNAGSVTPPTGFAKYLGFTSLSSYSSGATERFFFSQGIEGLNCADLAWGTANASAVTLSFWAYSSLTGTHSGSAQNEAGTRSYPFTYTINVANTWEYKTITITGCTDGVWLTDNQGGIYLNFNLGTGSTYLTTGNAWANGYYVGATGSVSVVGTNGATFYITGVQLEKGSTATSFDYRPYGTELQLCQRYYQQLGGETSYQYYGMGNSQATTSTGIFVNYLQQMRAAPSFNITNIANTMVLGLGGTKTPTAFGLDQTTTTNIQFSVSGMTGLTTYTSYQYLNNGSTAPRLTFSAEL